LPKLLKPSKPPKPPLHRRVLWALNLLALGLETLERVLWLKLRLLLKLLQQWADKALARLGFSKQCNQPRKPLVAHRVVSPQYLNLLDWSSWPLLVTSVQGCPKGLSNNYKTYRTTVKDLVLRSLRQTQARELEASTPRLPLVLRIR
jgi:hypothetical protein